MDSLLPVTVESDPEIQDKTRVLAILDPASQGTPGVFVVADPTIQDIADFKISVVLGLEPEVEVDPYLKISIILGLASDNPD